MPVILGLSFVHSSKFRRGYEWQALFFEDKSDNLDDLFLRVNQLIKMVSLIKKSELKTNSPEFRCLWGLIANHNEKCCLPACPLLCLASLCIEREDELLE